MVELSDLTEFNFTQTAGVACDSLSLRTADQNAMEEITAVKAYDGENLIFNGYCDNQIIKESDSGFEVYCYARSSASLLVDNEAQPFTYNNPTAKQLWYSFAKDFGFTCDLPMIECQQKYEVSKGVTCYGAISQFVSLLTGEQIYVSPENSIKLLEKSSRIKSLSSYNVMSAKAVINRSEPLTEICFKKTTSSAGYTLHTKSRLQEQGLNVRRQYVNLSALPQWQREYVVTQRLKASYEDYRILELTVSGYVKENLYQRFSYSSGLGSFDDYLLAEKKYICDKSGEYTKLTLKKEFDIKEITYVD
jgi:hypothetical protein